MSPEGSRTTREKVCFSFTASVLFSYFIFRQRSINESISRVFVSFINKKLHFFSENIKRSLSVSQSHSLTQGRRKNKEKKKEEGNKRGDAS